MEANGGKGTRIGAPNAPSRTSPNFNATPPSTTQPSAPAATSGARASGSVTLSNLSVTVNYDDLDKLGTLVKKQIDSELDAREKGKPSLSNFGNASGRNRVNS
jgi:hypothetical protein